jgi:uncharacterized membrane protein (UPF0127 family)
MSTHLTLVRNLTNPSIDPSLDKNEGLVLVEARDSRLDTSIHMFFVWTDLAIAWVNSNNEVVDTALAKAWRPFYAPSKPARYVVEFHPKRHGEFKAGDLISFDHV